MVQSICSCVGTGKSWGGSSVTVQQRVCFGKVGGFLLRILIKYVYTHTSLSLVKMFHQAIHLISITIIAQTITIVNTFSNKKETRKSLMAGDTRKCHLPYTILRGKHHDQCTRDGEHYEWCFWFRGATFFLEQPHVFFDQPDKPVSTLIARIQVLSASCLKLSFFLSFCVGALRTFRSTLTKD